MKQIIIDNDISELVKKTKSTSGINGPELAKTHLELGKYAARYMDEFEPNDTTVVAILRGGIFFAEGIYFELGCKFQIYNPKTEKFVKPDTKNIILVDSVINTGNTIKKIYEPGMYVACCVINEHAVELFGENLFAIRVSKNSFIGANVTSQSGEVGPDTTMRLFNLL